MRMMFPEGHPVLDKIPKAQDAALIKQFSNSSQRLIPKDRSMWLSRRPESLSLSLFVRSALSCMSYLGLCLNVIYLDYLWIWSTIWLRPELPSWWHQGPCEFLNQKHLKMDFHSQELISKNSIWIISVIQ